MAYKLDRVAVMKLGTQAAEVAVQGLSCLIENNSASAEVYFKEKREDGVDASADNGWRLGPGQTTSVPMTARDLSLAATAGNTDVRVLILDVE